MPMTKIELTNFTVFESLVVDLAPGINVFVGENGTGKTHLLKAAYAVLGTYSDAPIGVDWVERETSEVFMPWGANLERLIRHGAGFGSIEVWYDTEKPASVEIVRGIGAFDAAFSHMLPGRRVFVPSNTALDNAPGFLSLYVNREVHFSSVQRDLLMSAYLAPLRALDANISNWASLIERTIGGRIERRGETFFLIPADGLPEVEFDLLASGFQKLGLLWLLIQNGKLGPDQILFWDEPETNLNPKLMKVVAEVLVGLARNGLQVLLATHDYAFLKELELASEPSDGIRYNALYKDDTGKVQIESRDAAFRMENNPVSQAVGDLYERELARLISKKEGA